MTNILKIVSTTPKQQDHLLLGGDMILREQMLSFQKVWKYEHQRIKVPLSGSMTHLIPIRSIVCIKSESNYSTIYLVNGDKITTSKTLKHWVDMINSDYFVRCHNSYMVNIHYVTKYFTRELILQTTLDQNIPVSRSRKKLIVDII